MDILCSTLIDLHYILLRHMDRSRISPLWDYLLTSISRLDICKNKKGRKQLSSEKLLRKHELKFNKEWQKTKKLPKNLEKLIWNDKNVRIFLFYLKFGYIMFHPYWITLYPTNTYGSFAYLTTLRLPTNLHIPFGYMQKQEV